jgi:polysaccharide deacetylase 2 family uncharacterized protein YibQ
MTQRTGFWPVLFFLSLLTAPVHAQESNAAPVISIIIDDMGKRLVSGQRVLALPGPVACAFLPQAPYTSELATDAFNRGKEVMLHLPMDAISGHRLDAGAVTLEMTRYQFMQTVKKNLEAVPHVKGVNNHMGSLLTRHPGHMLWLMQVLQKQNSLFFVDSRTTASTVARQVAAENGVPNTERNVFLDHKLDAGTLEYEFNRLLQLARKQGSAVAIGHPHPQTLALLEKRLPQLEQQGFRLLPVSELINHQQEVEHSWQASWSPSHKAAKNSKPSL